MDIEQSRVTPAKQETFVHQAPLPMSLNHVAIVKSSQNKLPVDRVKSIVGRVGRPTISSDQKLGIWYRSPSYIDEQNFTWKNMPLYKDYHTHMWTDHGSVRDSLKKKK